MARIQTGISFSDVDLFKKQLLLCICIRMTSFFAVLGKIDPSEMGVTLSHEHLSADSRFFYVDPPKGSPIGIDKAPMTIQNLGFIKNYP